MKIVAILMVKNEMKRIPVTLQSISDLDALIVFDTGSTDGTQKFIRENSPVPVHMREGMFVDFKTSFNELFDFADECSKEFGYDYYVHLDANDEFVGKRPMIDDPNQKCWFVERHLKYGQNDTMTFWSIKLIKANTPEIRYTGVVHVYMENCHAPKRMRDFHIFQNRLLDDDKSSKRFHTDKILLMNAFENDPTDTRTLFYLAQTHSCIGEYETAYALYEKRSACVGGFEEERWYSMLQCAELSMKLGKDWETTLAWLMKALEQEVRAEPLVILADHYLKKNKHALAYSFSRLACELPYPDALLFVEKKNYEYTRWHILSIAAYYVAKTIPGSDSGREKMTIGRDACQKAIASAYDVGTDTRNLVWYSKELDF